MPLYQIRAEFELLKREGAILDPAPPSFQYMEAWPIVKTEVQDLQLAVIFEGSDGVPHAIDAVTLSLEEAVKSGLIAAKYDVKLFIDDAGAAAQGSVAAQGLMGPTGPVTPAIPLKSKKSRWAGLF
jgi:hypothetical protein